MRYVPSERMLRRGKLLVILLATIVVWLTFGALLWVSHQNDYLEQRDAQSQAERAELREQAERLEVEQKALARQVRRLGGKPVVPTTDLAEGEVIVIEGKRGLPGEPGKPGRDGKDGRPGRPGEDGADGIGEPGPAGSAGPEGRQGPQGDQGQQGPQGPAGPAGPPCPDGYHAEERDVMTTGNPFGEPMLVCVRDA